MKKWVLQEVHYKFPRTKAPLQPKAASAHDQSKEYYTVPNLCQWNPNRAQLAIPTYSGTNNFP